MGGADLGCLLDEAQIIYFEFMDRISDAEKSNILGCIKGQINLSSTSNFLFNKMGSAVCSYSQFEWSLNNLSRPQVERKESRIMLFFQILVSLRWFKYKNKPKIYREIWPPYFTNWFYKIQDQILKEAQFL